ncbi:MAG: sugar kinase [Symploca sp. SIO1C4]|uniref:Sugar kinase n=1 Tax=Symploca sp. SIO1C4 TaxID=2607765 RepID=A0A6B3NNI7_9CYAN|nr:sugar kinase [Symploca sp. SIO1C4]NET05632.1 sugar kinase [Symploca sp. SIO2B6]
MLKSGLFIGMVTLDLAYLSAKLPSNNEKITASDYTVSAGGPATNAAVTFGYLGNQAEILGVVGTHPITQLIRSDLGNYPVSITDLAPDYTEPPPVSSIIITEATGDRAVISLNATKIQVNPEQIPANVLNGVDLVMIDGHQMALSVAIAPLAKENNIPVVIDGGSWKPGFEKVLPFVDYAVCSANFYPPGCSNSKEVFAYLQSLGIPHIAITQGEKPIQYLSLGISGRLSVLIVNAVDTLGAGDIFHGAFCHYILQQNFTESLVAAAEIASNSCKFFGTRRWMEFYK